MPFPCSTFSCCVGKYEEKHSEKNLNAGSDCVDVREGALHFPLPQQKKNPGKHFSSVVCHSPHFVPNLYMFHFFCLKPVEGHLYCTILVTLNSKFRSQILKAVNKITATDLPLNPAGASEKNN